MSGDARTNGKITIIDVARMAGVSPSTVSRVINSPDLVNSETRKKVKKALDDTGFVPNLLAGGLSSKRSRTVALFIPSVAFGLFDTTIRVLVQEMAARGYQVLMGFGGRSDEEFNRSLVMALARQPDAIITIGLAYYPETRKRLLDAGIPIVQAWERPKNPVEMVAGFSHEEVGEALGEHALRMGYKRIHLLWNAGAKGSLMRFGLSRILLENGMPEPSIEIFPFPGNFMQGKNAMKGIARLGEDKRPDCVICASDWLAHGAIVGGLGAGMKIPEDIAVTGFGDLDFAEGIEPSLTTIRIDGEKIACQIVELLMERMSGKPVRQPIVDLGFELIQRQSG
ncbi:MAG: hypothetical protein BGO57_13865 [Sphingomonadales bacterium 63-6]|mgnify:CR=1 FL=1|nr:MAG: hypothetical protein BGO57_13865 [Sphingomonadales bacterium 63-6]